MANDFYTRTFNPLPGQRVDEQVLKDEFQLIEQAFDEVEDEADTLAARAIKIPESSPDQTLAFSAVQRANLVLAFDASGNITATSFGRWRGDWVTAVAYVANDSFRYAPTGSVYTVLVTHTSGVFADDLAANKFSLAIDGTGAAAAAASAANAATSETNAAASAVQASGSAASAAASYDAFDDRYLGSKAADPTLDNDGNALLEGALYWNNVSKQMRAYDGVAWQAAYLPGTGYATLTGIETLTNKTIDSASNSLRIRLARDARTSNTMLVAADGVIPKWIDITSGTFTQTADTATNLGAGWWVELGNSGSGVVTFGTLAIYQGQRYRLQSDGTTIRITGLTDLGVLHARDEKTSGSNGGTATSGSYQTRSLNTVLDNSITGATLASNQITLPAGVYDIDGSAPAYSTDMHQTQVYNVTGAASLFYGTTEYAFGGSSALSRSVFRGRIVLTATTVITVRHRVGTTRSTDGWGLPASFGVPEVFTEISIRKVA